MFDRFYTIPKPFEFLNLLAGTAVYILLLVIPPPPFISQALNQPGWMILLLLIGIFALLLCQRGTAWEGIQNAFVFALFALLLIHQWQFVPNYGEIIGGLLPWSDASGYLQEAQRLLNGSLLTSFGARRPLFPAFLAVLLQLSGGNFMITLAALTWVNAFAMLLVVREVRRSYGALGASVLLIFAYKFYLRFAGTTMTEQLGFALGNLALFLLLIAAENKNLKHALLGLGLLSLALVARAGAFFVLPALIIWIAITFKSKNILWHVLVPAIAIIASAFILNALLLRAIADPRGIPFSNYSETLYGLASGNKGWDQAGIDHPNASESEVMTLALQKIRSDPGLLLEGIIGSYRDYFTPLGGAFTFIIYSLYSFRTKANIILWLLTLAGLVYAALNWKKGSHALVLASFVGILASLTLVPPTDSDGMRVYAATILFTGLWIVDGLLALISWGKKLLKPKEKDSKEEVHLSIHNVGIGFSALLILLAIPAPILLHLFARSSLGSFHPLAPNDCGPYQQLLQGFMLKNIRVDLISNEAAKESYMPYIRMDDFQSSLINSFSDIPFLGQKLHSLQAGQQISTGFENNVGTAWLISSYPVEAGKFSVCGQASDNQELRQYNFYYLNGGLVRPSYFTLSQQYPGITLLFRLLYGLVAGIIMVLIAMDMYKFGQRSMPENLYLIGASTLLLLCVFAALYAQAIIHLPFAEQRTTLEVKDAVPKRPTHLYILPLGINWMNQADLGLSPAVVYENGIPLSSPNALHQTIKDVGMGGYSVWNSNLYFSSSDNTDPRTNGRTYEIEWPHPLRPVLLWIAYMGGILGLVMLVFREWLMRITENWLYKKSKK